jgi:hypothetical protein
VRLWPLHVGQCRHALDLDGMTPRFFSWLRLLAGGLYRPVSAEYASLSGKKHLLADIAMRGGISDAPRPADALTLAFEQGRRSLALEIITLANARPAEIEAFIKHMIANAPKKEPT